ncbi:LacI family DNA-binding transcriptional regulator [uncultured Ruthenibacterium sp.]|uniref:LacI family DNA-binding transcriptional regulator n=1 Tax=uncultured Ruthenibacterium sp. TaxID=1905347 RepID=UPI00349EA1B0
MSENKKSTIVDVARAAGTSTATVSRVLSGIDYPISRQLRQRVMQVARELNYKPNLIGKMLQAGSSEKEIGVILPSIVNPFYASLMSAVEEECVQRSYVPLLCLSQNSSRLETQHIEMLEQKQVSGILLSCIHMDEVFMERLRRLEIPCVLFDQTYEEYPGRNVGFDFYKGGMMATRYLIECGHRDIAFASGPLDRRSRKQRLDGYKAALRESGIRFNSRRLLVCNVSGDADGENAEFCNGYALGEQLLASECLPDAVVAINDMTAIGMIQCLKAHNVYVPADVSIIGFDNIYLSDFVEPALTTIHQPSNEMGRRAARMLLDAIEYPDSAQENVVMQPKLVERKSVRKVYRRVRRLLP